MAKMIGVVIKAVRKYPLSSFLAKRGANTADAAVNGFRITYCDNLLIGLGMITSLVGYF